MTHPITDKNNQPYGGFDTETVYTTDYSVSTYGNQGYVNDPRFDCYLISIDFPDWNWVGHPKDCPWEKLRGRSFVSANAGFDQAVLRRMIELGQAPAWVYPEDWVCSANLSVYCGYPRALGQCVEQLFGRVVDKKIRNVDMKGHNLDSMSPELREKVMIYAAADARECRLVWEELAGGWPLLERRVSELTYAMGARGMHADRAGVDADISMLRAANAAAFGKIPWTQTTPASVPLSPKALKAYCAGQGIEPPSSLAQTSEECAAWEEKYGEQFPIVGAMRDYRRTNALLKKYEVIAMRLNAEDRMPYSLKYFGASTGRWSGESGYNVQNQPRDPMYFAPDWSITRTKTDQFVEMRSKFTAAPGKKLIIADYAQIEARVLPWLAKDKETIDLVRSGLSVYDVHALQSGMWDGKGGSLKKMNKTLYALAKARVLGLGFGCGWLKFVTFARQSLKYEVGVFDQVFGAPVSAEARAAFVDYVTKYDKKGQTLPAFNRMTEREQNEWVNSWLQVTDFRDKNPKIVALWKHLDNGLKSSVGGTYEIGLPSGRVLQYFNVTSSGGEIRVRTTKGGHFSHAYGGLLTENLVQATARDVLAEALIRLADAGIHVIATIHDEVVCEVDPSVTMDTVVSLMTKPPAWAKTLPLGAEAEESQFYKK